MTKLLFYDSAQVGLDDHGQGYRKILGGDMVGEIAPAVAALSRPVQLHKLARNAGCEGFCAFNHG